MTIVLTASEAPFASEYDLTTLDAVRRAQQKTPGLALEQDDLIASLITQASTYIQGELERQFVPTSGERSFSYGGGGRLVIGDVRSVSAVTYDSDAATPTSLATGGWRLRPLSSQFGVFNSLYLPDYEDDTLREFWTDRVITVTGEWGFESVPADVEGVCIDMVIDALRGDLAFNEVGDVQRLGNSAQRLTKLRRYERRKYIY